MRVKSLVYLALPVAAIATLYAVLKPQRAADTRQASPAPTALVAPEKATPAGPASAAQATDEVRVLYAKPNTFDIVVQRGKRVSEPAILKVRKGDEITLRITTDSAEEFHLHGYNLHVQLTPERMATLQFTAKLTGRFVYELHRSGLELGALEVYPQ
jgi:hypothetical protein